MDEVSNLRLEDEDLLREAEGDTKRKKDAVALGLIKQQKEDEIRPAAMKFNRKKKNGNCQMSGGGSYRWCFVAEI